MKTVVDIILMASRLAALFMPVGIVLVLTDEEFTVKKLVEYILGKEDGEYAKLMRGDE